MTQGKVGPVLIIGTGSAGRRHARNLAQLAAKVVCFDPRADRLAQAKQELCSVELFDDLDAALRGQYSGAVVASPPSFHVDQAVECISRNIPVLLEKPVAPDIDSALKLKAEVARHETPLLLGYTYRWWPPLIELRQRVMSGVLGELRHARFVMSAHLADWHPWERYQDFFMASRELGGGALLDESHFIDLMLWMFGMPAAVSGAVEHLSTLEITTDDNVDVIFRYSNGFRATIHLDLFGRPHQKHVTVVGERGTLECLFDPNVITQHVSDQQPERVAFQCERNDMFLAEAKEFVNIMSQPDSRTRDTRVTCSLADGINVLRCIEAIRQSSREDRTVVLAAS